MVVAASHAATAEFNQNIPFSEQELSKGENRMAFTYISLLH